MKRRALLWGIAAPAGHRLMQRRSFLAAVAAMAAKPLLAETQQSGRLYTVGILSSGSASGIADVDRPFRETLAELGYVEGRNRLWRP